MDRYSFLCIARSYHATNNISLFRYGQWVEVQILGFTAWVNSFLQKRNEKITDLQKDFRDGLRLVSFLELAAGKSGRTQDII